MCDRRFHGSSRSSSTLGARGLEISKGGTEPYRTMQLKTVSPAYPNKGLASVFFFFVEPSTRSVYPLWRYPNSSLRYQK